MSKELDKVNEIYQTRAIYKADGTTVIESGWFNLLIAYAKDALQRLESIDNANPSEALEHLQWMGENLYVEIGDAEEDCTVYAKDYIGYDTIKQALLKAQTNARSEEILQKYYQEGITLDSVRELKQERDNYKKALEIIKEKCVDIYILKDLGTLDAYNEWVLQRYGTYYQLTQEEFNLLKEVLE